MTIIRPKLLLDHPRTLTAIEVPPLHIAHQFSQFTAKPANFLCPNDLLPLSDRESSGRGGGPSGTGGVVVATTGVAGGGRCDAAGFAGGGGGIVAGFRGGGGGTTLAVTPPAFPDLTANLPDCWRLLPRPT